MSVQIIENWSRIAGIVRTLQPSTEVKGFTIADVEVEQVTPVEGFPNLLEGAEGQTLPIHIPDELVDQLRIEALDRIECRVRRAGPDRYFVHRQEISIVSPDELSI